MIDRYSRPAMKQVWSEENTFDLWLKIEIAATNAWAQLGVVPPDQAEKIGKARFDRAEYDRWFESTKHDIVSFTRSVTSTIGPEGRWLHHGLTSNDVKDTALSIQLTQSVDLIDNECVRLMSSLRSVAEKFALTPCMGRSHGIHAEPMSFGLKAALWWDEMQRHLNRLQLLRSEVAVGMLRGSLMYYLGMVIISISFIYYSSLNFEVSLGWIIASIFWGRFKAKKELIEIDTKLIMEEKNIFLLLL